MSLGEFRDADGLATSQVNALRAESARLALSEAQRRRLVKGSKSPTAEKPDIFEPGIEPVTELTDSPSIFEKETHGPGRFTIIQFREWSDEYRIRTQVETSPGKLQPPEGPRYSDKLSARAARKITESCYYMAKKHGGFKTFVTGTFDQEARDRIASGETTIQREVSRTMDALQKMYQRGWTDSKGKRHAGHEGKLPYCWVVEVPKNDKGEDNPHVHMMLGWSVKYSAFDEWAARIESLWGNGFFHLEKIKDPLCAGSYMAKAAGYMTKGTDDESQGTVKGNRYGISASARAPGWETISRAELGVMGKLITELHERCTEKYGELYAKKAALKRRLDETPKQEKEARQRIGQDLEKARRAVEKIPVVASRYQTILKGAKTFAFFLGYATGAGWDAAKRPCSRWLDGFNRKLQRLRDERQTRAHRWSDREWAAALKEYAAYCGFGETENTLDEWQHYAATMQ